MKPVRIYMYSNTEHKYMLPESRKKRVKGEAVHWDEIKKSRTLNLTDSTWLELQRRGLDLGNISRSELIERWIRDDLQRRECCKEY